MAKRTAADGLKALKVILRDAVKAVYTQTVSLQNVEAEYPEAGSRHTVGAHVRLLPTGLQDTGDSLGLTRALNRAIGIQQRRAYTDAEQRQAVYEFVRSQERKTKRQIEDEYGISERALQRTRTLLFEAVGRRRDDKSLKAAAETLHIPRAGAQPYLTETENALLISKIGQRAALADGQSRRAMMSEGQQMVHAIGAAEQNPHVQARLQGAVCTRTWLAAAEARAGEVLQNKTGFRKPQAISHKRCAASAPR